VPGALIRWRSSASHFFSGGHDVSLRGRLDVSHALAPSCPPARPRSLSRVSLTFSFPLRPLSPDLGDVATTLTLPVRPPCQTPLPVSLMFLCLFRLASLCASRTLSDCLSLCASVCYVPHVLIVRRFWYVSFHFLSRSLRADRSPFHEGLLRFPLHSKLCDTFTALLFGHELSSQLVCAGIVPCFLC
jgi:hypothetical protein